MQMTSAPAILAICFALSACGKNLGTYKVEDVRSVREIPSGNEPPFERPRYPDYIRVELSSQTNLNDGDTGAGLYVDADFCPLRDPYRIIAFGPLAMDGRAVEDWKRTEKFTRDSRDGRFHYYVYVVPQSPRRKLIANSTDVIQSYDLKSQSRSICLRFHIPGYNITRSQSEAVEVLLQTPKVALTSG